MPTNKYHAVSRGYKWHQKNEVMFVGEARTNREILYTISLIMPMVLPDSFGKESYLYIIYKENEEGLSTETEVLDMLVQLGFTSVGGAYTSHMMFDPLDIVFSEDDSKLITVIRTVRTLIKVSN